MNISQRVMWIVGIPAAIGASIAGIATIAGAIKSRFWDSFNAWHVMFGFFCVVLVGLWLNWRKERLDFRFASVAKAIADLRKEIRDGLAEVRGERR